MKNKFFTTILFLVSSTAVMAQETGPVAQKASETLPKIMTDPLNFIIAFSFLVNDWSHTCFDAGNKNSHR
ncbi:MAG: hypothetical protein IPG39_00715 [Bacteroidetes bacterium]|nr:hypothetical protein [Bacteroidota bacterium]